MASMDGAILCRCIERNQPNLVGGLCMGSVIKTSLFYGEKAGKDFFWLPALLLAPPVPSRRARRLSGGQQRATGNGRPALDTTNNPSAVPSWEGSVCPEIRNAGLGRGGGKL